MKREDFPRTAPPEGIPKLPRAGRLPASREARASDVSFADCTCTFGSRKERTFILNAGGSEERSGSSEEEEDVVVVDVAEDVLFAVSGSKYHKCTLRLNAKQKKKKTCRLPTTHCLHEISSKN